MADNSFRSLRRDAVPRDPEPRDSDPLAELARIIGQSDPRGGQVRDLQQHNGFDDAPPQPGLDWAAGDDGYAEQHYDTDEGYAQPRSAEAYHQQPSVRVTPDIGYERDRHYDEEPAHPRQYPGPPPSYADERDDSHAAAPRPGGSGRSPMSYLSSGADGQPPRGAQAPSYADEYAPEEYGEEAPQPRRSGTVVILAVLGLAVLGTAGALGYRAVFGSSVLPSLPPIIKPGEGPTKIVPHHDAQGGPPNPAVGNRGPGVQVVPHQEQPVDLPPANPTPRVITTIPVLSNSPNAVAEAPGNGTAPNSPQAGGAPNGGTVVPNQLAPSPSPLPPGTKEVHTVTIHPGEENGANPAAPPAPALEPAPQPEPARAPVAHPVRSRPAPPRPRRSPPSETVAGPLSIVPIQDRANLPPPSRTHTALARPPRSTPTQLETPTGGSRYAVQVSSQRSEAEALASFRSLQARFPQQLGGRHVIVRRADLGAKGIYYRALVGPFASAEQAAALCSSLKSVGGNCLIQRN